MPVSSAMRVMETSEEESLALVEAQFNKTPVCLSYRLVVWVLLGMGSALSFFGVSSHAAVFTCRRLTVACGDDSTAATTINTGIATPQSSFNITAAVDQQQQQQQLLNMSSWELSGGISSEWNSTGNNTEEKSGYGGRNGLNIGIVTVGSGALTGRSGVPESGSNKSNSERSSEGYVVARNGSDSCPLWTKQAEGWVLAALSSGYCVIQLPAAILSMHVGVRLVCLTATCLCVLTSLLSVPLLSWGPAASGVLCFLKGASSGAMFPCMVSLASVWSGKTETSLVSSIVESGLQVGHSMSFLAALAFCDGGEGWANVFYMQATMGAIVAVGLWTMVTESPGEMTKCQCLPEDERNFLSISMKSKGFSSGKTKIPFRSIMTSLPFIAIVIGQLGSEWVDCLLVTSLPQFMGVRLGMKASWVELLTSAGFLLSIPVAVLGARVADWMLEGPHFTPSTVRKIFEVLGKGLPAVCFLLLTYLDFSQVRWAAAVYLMGTSSFGLTDSGWPANCFDLAPAFTGVLVSLAEALTSWLWAVCAIAVVYIAPEDTEEQWRTVMNLTGGLMLACVLFYCIFASGERQTWAYPQP